MKTARARMLAAEVAVASLAAVVPSAASTATFEGEYVGMPIATNAGRLGGRPCPQGRLRPVELDVANNTATLVYNRNTHLIFSGPITAGGAVVIPGRNDFGAAGMSLNGVNANGQFDGSTFGLACNAELQLTRISTTVSSAPAGVVLGRRRVPRDSETMVASAAHVRVTEGVTNCTAGFLPALELVIPPKHGTVRFAAADLGIQPRTGCNSPVYGTAVFYRPSPGFVGEDQFTLRVPPDPTAFWHVGSTAEIHMMIVSVH
jgi:hypothetical protein